jgi:hypothetical protein
MWVRLEVREGPHLGMRATYTPLHPEVPAFLRASKDLP